MKQQAVLPIRRDDDINPKDIIPARWCPLCSADILETDNVTVLITRGSVCLIHTNCDEIEDVDDDDDDDESDIIEGELI